MSSHPFALSPKELSPRAADGMHVGVSLPKHDGRDSAIQLLRQRHELTLLTKEAGLELE